MTSIAQLREICRVLQLLIFTACCCAVVPVYSYVLCVGTKLWVLLWAVMSSVFSIQPIMRSLLICCPMGTALKIWRLFELLFLQFLLLMTIQRPLSCPTRTSIKANCSVSRMRACGINRVLRFIQLPLLRKMTIKSCYTGPIENTMS